ncbi:MAG: ABC transporter ATP-binding protein/permease [Coxiellaceae bacterium]|nr:ABC transporter ATP-binding protein/permease [Coxiellaceae bacterium]
MRADTVLNMPLIAANHVRTTFIQDLKVDITTGLRTFLMADIWSQCSFKQRMRLLGAYFINLTFAVMRPLSALLLSKSLQALASHQPEFSLFSIKMTPKHALYVSVCLTGLDFMSEYLKSCVLAGIASDIELKKVSGILREYHAQQYQNHLAFRPEAQEVLSDITGAYQSIQVASVGNLQPQLFNLIAASAASFLLEHKALTWLVIPYIVIALIVKELVHCCSRKGNASPTITRQDVLQRYRPSYGKSAMMYAFGRQQLEAEITIDTLSQASKNRGAPKWHQNYRFLLGILTLSLSAYYIETVASNGLKPANIGQVTYMLTYLTTLFNSFAFFNQSVTDVKSSYSAIENASIFKQRLLNSKQYDVPEQAANSDYAIELRDVGYHYAVKPAMEEQKASALERPVLNHIDLSVEPGQIALLSGPSGSGKSTLAKLITGLNYATSGAVFINGRNASTLSAKERAATVAYVPQCFKLEPGKSVLYHMAYALCSDEQLAEVNNSSTDALTSAMKGAAVYEQMRDLLRRCGLRDRDMDKLESQLSTGDRYKLSLAMALAKGAKVLVIDQMFGSFDDATATHLRHVVNDMAGVTRLIITDHPEHFAADKHYALSEYGQIQEAPTHALSV